jgi:hypothetical protein
MIQLNNKFAIGCLIQWYEIELIPQYLESVKQSLNHIENKKNVIIDLYFNTSQALEKIDKNQIKLSDIKSKYKKILKDIFDYDEDDVSIVGSEYDIRLNQNKHDEEIYTIADYRRDFNDKYCEKVDVLMWGESDSLIPRQTFQILDSLHTSVKEQTPKYVLFFGTCKMWDESWKPIEHTDFTDKPFIDGDTKNWWSLRYSMNQEEMDKVNSKVEELDVRTVNPYKFNGCGLVISSDVVKSGVNIPRSVFFIHEDTAFLNLLQNMFKNTIPQYVIKNILLVHNRKHPDKRMYIKGESGIEGQDVGAKRLTHSWYDKANKLCEHNAYNLFNQSQTYTWEDVFEDENR